MTEGQFHKAVAELLSVALGGCAWFSTIGHGGGGSSRGAVLRGRGMKAGVPDILLIDGGRPYWLELKSAKGSLSPVQRTCHEALARAGSPVAVCKTLDDVIGALKRWGVALRVSAA